MPEQPFLALIVERNQAARASQHGIAVAQEKEQQKQHDCESEQRTQGAEKETAAQAGGALQNLAGAGNQPGLNLLRRNARVRLQPNVDARDPGKLLQIGKRFDVELGGGFLQLLQQRRNLRHEIDRQRAQGQQDGDRREHRQHARRNPPARESAPQAQIQRIQQECEKRGPGHGADKRRENQDQGVAQNGGDDERENARIKARCGRHRAILPLRPAGRPANGTTVISITVNNQMVNVDAEPDTPLLWVLRDHLGMTGTKFGCGMALCGACTVHIDGAATRSCVLPLSAVAGKSITTIEGLSRDRSHAVQKAWLEIDVPQCGYCQSGQIMSAAALLKAQSQTQRRRYRCGHVRQYLPLRYLPKNPQGDSPRRGIAREGRGEVRPVSDPSRRDFLNATATVGGGLILALALPEARRPARSSAAAGRCRGSPAGGQLNAWLKIAGDNSITIIVDRSEMGQGVYTALPMLLAEELNIDFDAIRIVAAPVGDAYINPGNGGQITGTSNSVQDVLGQAAHGGRNRAHHADCGCGQALARRSGTVPRREWQHRQRTGQGPDLRPAGRLRPRSCRFPKT